MPTATPHRSTRRTFFSSSGFFAIAFIATGCITFALFALNQDHRVEPSKTGGADVAIASYLLFVGALPAALGFALVTTASHTFRDPRFNRRVLVSAVAGALSYLAQLSGLAHVVAYYAVPHDLGVLTVALYLLFPGLVAGLLALAFIRTFRVGPAAPVQPQATDEPRS